MATTEEREPSRWAVPTVCLPHNSAPVPRAAVICGYLLTLLGFALGLLLLGGLAMIVLFMGDLAYGQVTSRIGSLIALALALFFGCWIIIRIFGLADSLLSGHWWAKRRLRANQCPQCRYDIRDLPEPRCPECGETWSES